MISKIVLYISTSKLLQSDICVEILAGLIEYGSMECTRQVDRAQYWPPCKDPEAPEGEQDGQNNEVCQSS